MLKDKVTYTDFENVKHVDEELHFHLSEADVTDMIDIQPQLEEWQKIIDQNRRELEPHEIKKLLSIIRVFVEKSYGVKDGKYFRKSPESFRDFRDSGAYDAYLLSMFTDIAKGEAFMRGIFTEDLQSRLAEAVAKQTGEPAAVPSITSVTKEEVFDPEREYSPAEFSKLTPAQMQQAFAAKSRRNAES